MSSLLIPSTPSIGYIYLDAVTSAREIMSNQVTQYPVNANVKGSNHVIINPDIFELEGLIGSTALASPNPNASQMIGAVGSLADANNIQGIVDSVTNDLASSIPVSGSDRVGMVLAALRSLRNSGSRFTMVTCHRVVRSCVITNIDVRDTVRSGIATEVSITVQQMPRFDSFVNGLGLNSAVSSIVSNLKSFAGVKI